MATSFIGKAISLLSHSDVRYRGILAGLDPQNSTIQLRNVYSMGTEDRRPPQEFIPPAEQPYQYIIFRASEVKDIALDNNEEPAMRTRSVHDDPAVIGASGPPMANGAYGQFYPGAAQPGITPPPQQVPATLGSRPPPGTIPQPGVSPAAVQRTASANGEQLAQPHVQGSGRTSSNSRRGNNNSVSNAAASLEKVERALGDLRISNAQARGRRNGGGRQHAEIKVPPTDFDFAGSNARFDKTAVGGRTPTQGEESDANTNPSDEEAEAEADAQPKAAASKNAKDKDKDPAYNPKKSFFDMLSSSANGAPLQNGGAARGGGGRRGMGKSRREEEREKNVATFGEPGGVGLMGPGAYVGGYGGYGRRGGGRGGRRGGGGRRNAGAVAGAGGAEQ